MADLVTTPVAHPCTNEASMLASTLPVGPLEVTELCLEPSSYSPSSIGVCLLSPTANTVVLARVPHSARVAWPLEFKFTSVGAYHAPPSLAHCFSTHALLCVVVETNGQSRISTSVPVSLRPSDGVWVLRLLMRPPPWTGATSVTVMSLLLAGRPVLCADLPFTLRVHNHAPAPAGAVVAAAAAGNASGIHAALDAGRSTEEADEVCTTSYLFRCQCVSIQMPNPILMQDGCTASWYAASAGHLEALRTLLAAGADPAAPNKARRGRRVRCVAPPELGLHWQHSPA